jgi:hypothetical protein
MFREVDRVVEEAMHLTPEERIEVADKLYQSVRDDDVMQAWLDEAERRKALWEAGSLEDIDGEEVIRGLRQRAEQ